LLFLDDGAGAMGGENEAGSVAGGDAGHVDRLGVCPLASRSCCSRRSGVQKFMQPPLFRCQLFVVHRACRSGVQKFMQPPLFRCQLFVVHRACAMQCLRRADLLKLDLQSSLRTWLLSGSRESLEVGQFFVLLPVGEQPRPCGSQRLSTREIGRDREKRERRMNITHCSM